MKGYYKRIIDYPILICLIALFLVLIVENEISSDRIATTISRTICAVIIYM